METTFEKQGWDEMVWTLRGGIVDIRERMLKLPGRRKTTGKDDWVKKDMEMVGVILGTG